MGSDSCRKLDVVRREFSEHSPDKYFFFCKKYLLSMIALQISYNILVRSFEMKKSAGLCLHSAPELEFGIIASPSIMPAKHGCIFIFHPCIATKLISVFEHSYVSFKDEKIALIQLIKLGNSYLQTKNKIMSSRYLYHLKILSLREINFFS